LIQDALAFLFKTVNTVFNRKRRYNMNTNPNPSRRTAIVTGGSQGLGLALVTELSRTGWNVITDARSADGLATATQSLANVIAIAGDITDQTHRSALVDAAVTAGGAIDLIVNNASTLGALPMPTLINAELADINATFATNVSAPMGLIQAAKPHLVENPIVINISSDAGVEGYPGWGTYGVSKAALDQLTRVLAAEQKVWHVYSVDPGDMRTAMHQDAFPGEDISDRPDPIVSVPGIMALIDSGKPSGRYVARDLAHPNNEQEVA
jgi:NAD(P)-dependent dehydrogenase (short-subunit alcohol dehydrogenase family)